MHIAELGISIRLNPIQQFKTISFEKIIQQEMREEEKKGIHLNLQKEAISCVQKEMTALRRFSRFLVERYPQMRSFSEIDRNLMEEYIIYLKMEQEEIKTLHAEMTRFRAALESIAMACGYQNLAGVFLARDIPPYVRKELKSYSDEELCQLNAALVKLDEQVARLMIIHQMLGTRISDTLTLAPDCLHEKDGVTSIRIRQMKAGTYEKPISDELAELICRAIAYTRERCGETPYIFTDERHPDKPMQYGTICTKIVSMFCREYRYDDSGESFGFGTHLYRSLDGWEEEYVKIQEDGSLE